MPQCTVKQPDGKFGYWSSIVDDFLLLDATKQEVIQYAVNRDMGQYPGGEEALRADMEMEFVHIDRSGTAWDWSPDWNSALGTVKLHNNASLELIKKLGLNKRMKEFDKLTAERYWHNYWRAKCQALEHALEMSNYHLAVKVQELQRLQQERTQKAEQQQ